MKVSFLGAAGTVTGSCFLLEHEGNRFLVDCGMFQGSKELKERNYAPFSFNPAEIDFVLLTHAHIDHSGLLPKLVRNGFHGKIYATSGTVDLCSIMLPDSAYIQEGEVERKNRKALRSGQPLITPIYTVPDAQQTVAMMQRKDYDAPFSPADGIDVAFLDAGHILGSAMAAIAYTEAGERRRMVFTGDLGRFDHYIVNNPETVDQADFVVMETTYGNRVHTADPVAPPERRRQLAKIINDTFDRGGNVIIPSFAVDRCQDLIIEINALIDEGLLKKTKIYIDSPLAVKATQIFSEHPECFDEDTLALVKKYGGSPFLTDNLVFSQTVEDSMAINAIKKGAIVISASGMADAGRIKHHLKHNLWRPECTVIFVGYQAEGTLGRRLVQGEKMVKIHGEEIEVKAQIVMLDGYSAHADKNEMCRWLSGFSKPPARLFLVHGEEDSRAAFAETVSQKFGFACESPEWGEVFDLAQAQIVPAAERVHQDLRDITPSQLFLDISQVLSALAREKDIQKLLAIHEFIDKLS